MRSGNANRRTFTPGDVLHGVAAGNDHAQVGCAMCIYDMDGVAGCKPAVVVEGQPRLMTGVDMDLHAFGLCTGPRQAVISGRLEGPTFLATKVKVQ